MNSRNLGNALVSLTHLRYYENMQKTLNSHSLEETALIAQQWLEEISKKPESQKAVLVGLSGHLGAGKTAFTKAVAKELGIDEEVTSPTFVIMKIYKTTHSRWKQLIHIDAYRLESREEMNVLRLEEVKKDPTNLVMIEWPEKVSLQDELDRWLKFEIKNNVFHIEFN
jgi:tRNA threonylcarbamoyladenosine biosynthesis protein TsaE